MSLIPPFEIGVWNVWIFMVIWLFFNAADPNWLARRHDFKALFKKSSVIPSYTRTEKPIFVLLMAIQVLLLAYSIFLPIKIGTPWFYAGLGIFLMGLVVWEVAGISWVVTPINEPVTRGIYHYSRHPMYIAIFLQLTGAGIVSASGLFLLLVTMRTLSEFFLVISEERYCLEKYSEAYREYMIRTPRLIGIPKS